MRNIRAALGVAALAGAAVIGLSTNASAASGSDSYTLHGVTILGLNHSSDGPWVFADLCNHQGSANSFHLWINDVDGTRLASATTPVLQPGQCYSDYEGYLQGDERGTDSIQVFASSGNLWSFGTDPISRDNG
ncbi:hypothetical protein ABZ832_06740 [Streptantibioticus parmotrematis]|uniref:hypothetical protein n=1 Tax=Streptantibioticus parmotrematis TaxID=2873249 RepID=UPI00340E3544